MTDRDGKDPTGDDAKRAPEVSPDAPPTPEEEAASRRLRDALADPAITDADADFARSLRAAWEPSAVSAEEHDAIVELADVSGEERAAAAKLREALENQTGTGDAALALALGAAWNPKALGEEEHRAIVARALAAAPRAVRRSTVPRRGLPRVVLRVMFGTTTALALAASIALVIWKGPLRGSGEERLSRARSTEPLFGEPFKLGEASARIDRIAVSRTADFRDNRFAKWGVR